MRTITYDYNDEGVRTREIDLTRRRTRMLYSSFGLVYIGFYICWLFEWTLIELGRYAIWAIADSWASEDLGWIWIIGLFSEHLLISWVCSWVSDGPWLNWGDKAVFTNAWYRVNGWEEVTAVGSSILMKFGLSILK